MTALAELRRHGLTVTIVGGKPRIGPPEALTPEARDLVNRLAADIRSELQARYRAWRCRFADGRTMTVLHPAGMDRAEALAAVDRWPGCTVEPLPASACTIPTTAISRL